jgi:hypothetical protein
MSVNIVTIVKDDDSKQQIIIKSISSTTNTIRPLIHTDADGKLQTIESLNKQETYVDADGETWILPMSKKFPDFIKSKYGQPKYMSNKKTFMDRIIDSQHSGVQNSTPFPYQLFVRDYLRFGTPYRGLLLEHGLGSGKTLSAILVAKTFRKAGYKTLILTPAFLKLNFVEELIKWEDSDIKLNDWYEFAHYNATGASIGSKNAGKGGVFDQLSDYGIGFSKDDPEYGKLFPYLHNKARMPLAPPRNRLIIIEEAHNLNRSFINDGPNTVRSKLYPLLMKAVDCKVICLTGTPVISNPYEMTTMYNILRGPLKDGHTAFPTNEHTFNTNYVDYSTQSFTNTDVMMRRMIGLNSFFVGITNDVERVIFPGRKDITMNVIASSYQTYEHDALFNMESSMKSSKKKKLVSLSGASSVAMSDEQSDVTPPSSYFSKSRAACNFVFPKEVTRPQVKIIHWDNLEQYIYEFIMPNDQQPETVEDYQHIYEALTTDVTFEDEEVVATWEDLVETEDTEALHNFLSDKMSSYHNVLETNRGMPDNFSIKKFLSPTDLRLIDSTVGEYKDRMRLALEDLTNLRIGDKSIFSMKLLSTYSAKMYNIYNMIANDIENGAPHLVDIDPVKEDKVIHKPLTENMLQVDDGEELEPPLDLEEDVELATDVLTSINQSVNVIDDPDDPMLLHDDVFKSDEELLAMGKRVSGGPALVYSYFSTAEGAAIFSMILKAHGFENFSNSTQHTEDLTRRKRYAFFRGGMDKDIKRNILRIFNSKENVNGQLIRVIFATQAAAEGISLFNLRQIHIMEPHWDNTMIEQVIGRGFRLYAHQYIKRYQERYISVYRYFTTRPDEDAMNKTYHNYYDDIGDIGPTAMMTDHYIQTIADRKDALRHKLHDIRVKIAVDCMINIEANVDTDGNALVKDGCFNFTDIAGVAYNPSTVEDVEQTTVNTKVSKEQVRFISAKSNGTIKHYYYYDNLPVFLQFITPRTDVNMAALYKATKLYGPISKIPDEQELPTYQLMGVTAGYTSNAFKGLALVGTVREISPDKIKSRSSSSSSSSSSTSSSKSTSSKSTSSKSTSSKSTSSKSKSKSGSKSTTKSDKTKPRPGPGPESGPA